MSSEAFLINPLRRRGRGSRLRSLMRNRRRARFNSLGSRSRSRLGSRFGFRGRSKNPLGEEVMLVGLNRKRKRNKKGKVKKARKAGRKALMRGRHKVTGSLRINRRRRRNPVGLGAIVSQTTSVLPLIGTGTVSGIATYTVPKLLKVTGYVAYGVQAAVIMGGGWFVDRQFGKEHSKAWIIGGSSALLASILQSTVSGALRLAGIDLGREEYAAFPQEYAAFPQEYEGIEGVGREEYADAYFGQEDEEEIAY